MAKITRIDQEYNSSVPIIEVEGALNSFGAAQLADVFQEIILEAQKNVIPFIVLALHIDQMSSSGLRTLKAAQRVLAKEIRIIPNEHAQKMLELAGDDRLYPFYPSVEAALRGQE
ncbi:MAG TPA: STAS domain-containing protein [Patescibacteria group bacterium]